MSDEQNLRRVIHDAIASYQGIDGRGPDWAEGGEEPWLIADLVVEALRRQEEA